MLSENAKGWPKWRDLFTTGLSLAGSFPTGFVPNLQTVSRSETRSEAAPLADKDAIWHWALIYSRPNGGNAHFVLIVWKLSRRVSFFEIFCCDKYVSCFFPIQTALIFVPVFSLCTPRLARTAFVDLATIVGVWMIRGGNEIQQTNLILFTNAPYLPLKSRLVYQQQW